MATTPALFRAAALGALVALSSCAPWQEPEWSEFAIGDRPFEDAWQAVVRAAASDGFRVDEAATDRGERILVTMWRSRAMPFRGSVRRRVHAEFEQDEERGMVIYYYVERQQVDDLAAGFTPEEASWEDAGQDVDFERILGHKLKNTFADWPNVSTERR